MEIKANIIDYSGENNQEYLDKLSKYKKEELEKKSKQKKEEKEKLYQSIPKGLDQQAYKERQQEIDDKVQKLFPASIAKPIKIVGENGAIVSQHKNKLAFIFIGDVKKAEDSGGAINAPKISMIVGGGLESSTNPETGKDVEIDPRQDSLFGVSSQLHLISLADIDVAGILPVSKLKNRSAIRTEADVLELAASEIVLIRSLGRPYNSSGARTLTPGGVHIVSGINRIDKNQEVVELIKEPEPMVLGKALADTLFELSNKVNEINSVLLSINEDVLALKTALIAHVHPIPTPVPIVSLPSVELGLAISPTIASKTVLNITNVYSNLINMELLTLNNMTPLSSNKFLSDFNRVN